MLQFNFAIYCKCKLLFILFDTAHTFYGGSDYNLLLNTKLWVIYRSNSGNTRFNFRVAGVCHIVESWTLSQFLALVLKTIQKAA